MFGHATIAPVPLVEIKGDKGEILRFEQNGDIFVHGELITNNQQVVEGFTDFLRGQGFYMMTTKDQENKSLREAFTMILGNIPDSYELLSSDEIKYRFESIRNILMLEECKLRYPLG